jgi:hypothetical protein
MPPCSTRACPAWLAGSAIPRPALAWPPRPRRWACRRREACGHGRAGPDGRPGGPARTAARPDHHVRPTPDRLQDTGRRAVRRGAAGRRDRLALPGRHPPVLLLRAGGPAHRPGRHRTFLRRQGPPRLPVPPGPPILRWALFEAGHQASRASSPDHRYYTDVAARIDPNRAALSVARKLARRSHHILRRLGDQAYAPSRPSGGEANAGGSGGPHATDAPWPTPRGRRPGTSLLAARQYRVGRPRKTGAAAPPAGPHHRSS